MPPVTQYVEQKTRFDVYSKQTGKKLIVYHTNWSMYGKNFQISDIPIKKIDDVCYAFFNVKENGEVTSSDTWADFEKRYSNEVPFYGNFGEFYKLKENGEKFNLILSIGGWSWSRNFSSAVLPENRDRFVQSLLAIFKKYPIFSGVNLDWEYCTDDNTNYGNDGNLTNKDDADNFKELCKLLRETLDKNNKKNYIISICCSSNPVIAKKLKIKQLKEYVNEFHIMTYDFAGHKGQTIVQPHTNLKKCEYTSFSIEEAIDFYLSQEVNSRKLFIGVALYSRGFKNCLGPGTSGEGGLEIIDYKYLPLEGSTEYWDSNTFSSFSYDESGKNYYSYDNTASVYEKAKYVWEKDLGGMIAWESSCDHEPVSLISIMNLYLKQDPRLLDPPVFPEVWVGTSPEPSKEIKPVTKPWEKGILYELYDTVLYKDTLYKCIIAHTSNSGWTPDVAVTLWAKNISNKPSDSVEPPKVIDVIDNDDNIDTVGGPCKCLCKKIKTVKITGDIDLSNLEIVYE